MGRLSDLASAIETGGRFRDLRISPVPGNNPIVLTDPPPFGYGDIDPALARRNAATADAIRAAGVPDFLNLFLPQNANRRVRKEEPMKKYHSPGPKEAALRALRTTVAPKATATPTPKASAPAKQTATEPKADVATKEKTMKTRKTSTTTKAKSRSAVKGKTKAASGDGKSKVQIVADLLKRKGGCTAKDVLEATGWPAVSMPQQAKAAGLTLKKDKQPGQPTRYSAA